jgi:hypothetical protein
VVVIAPPGGSTAGGETVTVNGQNFNSSDSTPTTVQFINIRTQASTAGTNVVVNSAGNQLTVQQPALSVGTYDITVTTNMGTSDLVPTDQFIVGPAVQYVSPNSGPHAGGTQVTVLGANLTGATQVLFGTTPGTNITNNSFSSLTVTAPALAVGSYDIMVTTPGGTSLTSPLDRYNAGATVTGLSPSVGSSKLSTPITITGADLTGATEVDFGTTKVTNGISVNPAGTSLTVTAPGGLAQGTYNVTVVTADNGSSVPSSAAQFVVDPLTFTINNMTGLANSVPIYVALFGQLAFNNTTGVLDQHPTATSLQDDNLVEVSFNPSGQYALTAPLYIGHAAPNFNTVPTYQLAFTNGPAFVTLPHIYINSARVVLGVNMPPQAQVVDPTGAISAPALGNPSDPNHKILYDFLEFTLNENNQLFSNTSQVDQYGIPMAVTVNPPDPNVTGGVGVLVDRNDTFGTTGNSFSTYLTSVGGTAAADFGILATEEGSTTIDGVSYPYRVLAPADLLGLQPTNNLSMYFDSALTTLFTTSRSDLSLLVPNPNAGQSGSNNMVNPLDSGLANYTFTGTVANNLLQFTTTINQSMQETLTVMAPPSGMGSAMVFACNGVFADNVARFGAPDNTLKSLNSLLSNLLGNIENQVVSALNRGIANSSTMGYANTTYAWVGTQQNNNTDHLPYYQPKSTSNFYAGYFHANIGGMNVSQNRLAYGFAFDDQGNQSSTQVSTDPQAVKITLGPWAPTPSTPPPDSNGDFVGDLYVRLLGRTAEPTGLAFWVSQLAGGVSRDAVALGIANSVEAQGLVVENLYLHLLHRPSDPQGKAAFMALLAAGGTEAQVKADIYASPEYYQTRGGQTNDGFLDALYHDELYRAIDSQGQTIFGEALAMGNSSRRAVALDVIESPEGQQVLVRRDYGTNLFRTVDPTGLTFWTGQLQKGQTEADVLAGILSSDEFFFGS